MKNNYDENFINLKKEKFEKFIEEFEKFKSEYIDERLAYDDFLKIIWDRRYLIDTTLVSGRTTNDEMKNEIIHKFEYLQKRFSNPMSYFIENEYSKTENKFKDRFSSRKDAGLKIEFDYKFLQKKGFSHIIELIANYQAHSDFIDILRKKGFYSASESDFIYEENFSGLEDESFENNIIEPDFNLIKLDKTDNQIDKIIKLTHKELNGTYIDIDFKHFERHFKDNGEAIVLIKWLGKKGELKGFVDTYIINEKIILPKKMGNNQFIEQHFFSHNFKVSARSLGSVGGTKAYEDIVKEKASHPINSILSKIKSIVS